jgi:hypothetical protein
MKKTILFGFIYFLGVLQFNQAHALTSAEAAFDKMKSLAGEWHGTDPQQGGVVVYEVRSDGQSLLESFEGMITVYHLDGDSILMTHYCSMGNQPRLRATQFDGSVLDFNFVDVSNLKPGTGHVGHLKLEFLADGKIKQTWSDIKNGKLEESFSIILEKVKPKD